MVAYFLSRRPERYSLSVLQWQRWFSKEDKRNKSLRLTFSKICKAFVISRWCFADNGLEMYQYSKRMCRTIALIIKPFLGGVLVGVGFVVCLSSHEWEKTCSFGNMLNSFQSVIEPWVQDLCLPHLKTEALGIEVFLVGQWKEDPCTAVVLGLNGSSVLSCAFSRPLFVCDQLVLFHHCYKTQTNQLRRPFWRPLEKAVTALGLKVNGYTSPCTII